MKKERRTWRRFLSAFLVLVLVVTGVRFSAPEEVQAMELQEPKGERAHEFKWEFTSFTKEAVYKNGSLDPTKVKTENFSNTTFVDSLMRMSSVETANCSIGTLLATTKKGAPAITYYNAGTISEFVGGDYQKTKVDLKITLMDWAQPTGEAETNAFVCFSTCVLEDSLAVEGNHDSKAMGVWPSTNVSWVDLKYEFYRHGTNEKITVEGYLTQTDLDYLQYFAFNDSTSGITDLYRSEYDTLITEDGSHHITAEQNHRGTEAKSGWTTVNASATGTIPLMNDIKTYPAYNGHGYDAGYVTFVFKSSELDFRFGTKASQGTASKNGTVGNYYFGVLPYSITSFKAPQPEKYVSGTAKSVSEIKESTAYKKDGKKDIYYAGYIYLPRSLSHNYNSFEFSDTLNTVLDVENTRVSVWKNGTENVSNWFDIVKKGQTITATAKASTIAEKGIDFFGNAYQLLIETRIKESITLNNLDSLTTVEGSNITKEGNYYGIPNTVTCTTGIYDYKLNSGAGGYKKESVDSAPVKVYYTEPAYAIEKRVLNRKGEQVDTVPADPAQAFTEGEEVTFEIYAVQKNAGAVAKEMYVSDSQMPNCFTMKEITAEVHAGEKVYRSGSSPELVRIADGYRFMGELGVGSITKTDTKVSASGDYMKLTVKGTVTGAGTNDENKAEAGTVGNTVTDTAVINTVDSAALEPQINVTKTFDKKELEVTGKAYATITIQQSENNARKDLTAYIYQLNDYADEWRAYDKAYGGTARYFHNTGAVTVIRQEAGGKKTDLTRDFTRGLIDPDDGSGGVIFDGSTRFYYSPEYMDEGISFNYGDKIIIKYQVTADVVPLAERDYLGVYDQPCINTVQVKKGWISGGREYHGNSFVQASAQIQVIEPSVYVTKTADKEVYQQGETASYTVTLEKGSNGLSSPAVFTDYFCGETFTAHAGSVPESFYTGIRDSLKITDETGADVTSKYTVAVLDSKDSALPESVRGKAPGKVLAVFKKSAAGAYEEFTLDKTLTITYQVPLTQSWMANTTLDNRCDVTSSVSRPDSAEEHISVVKPTLSIVKQAAVYSGTDLAGAQQAEYGKTVSAKPGDRVWYQVEIKNTAPGTTAENVVVQDVSLPAGMTVEKNSVKITDEEGMEVSGLTVNYRGTGFTVTITQLQQKPYRIWYSAVSSKDVAGRPVVNTVTASADNAETVSDRATVTVTQPDVPELAITKTADRTSCTPYSDVRYTVTVTNLNDYVDAEQVVITDIIEADDSVCTLDESSAAFYVNDLRTNAQIDFETQQPGGYRVIKVTTRRDLTGGETYTLKYTVRYKDKTGTYKNHAEASADNAPKVEDDYEVKVAYQSELFTFDKEVDQEECNVGDIVTYTFNMTNTSGEDLIQTEMYDSSLSGKKDTIQFLEDPVFQVLDAAGRVTNAIPLEIDYSPESNYFFVTVESGTMFPDGYTLHGEVKAQAKKAAGYLQNTAYAFGANRSGDDELDDSASIRIIDPKPPEISVSLTKKILAEDIQWENGNPIFTLHLEGTDTSGTKHGYNRTVEFTKDYVEAHTESDGYVGITVTIEGIPLGLYKATEKDCLRYRLKEITVGKNGTVEGESAVLDMRSASDGDSTSAAFVNEKTQWQYFTDTDLVVNHFGQETD